MLFWILIVGVKKVRFLPCFETTKKILFCGICIRQRMYKKSSSQTSFSKKKRVLSTQDAYASIVVQCVVHRHRRLSLKIKNVIKTYNFHSFRTVPRGPIQHMFTSLVDI